jgi:hypothetical protein
MERAVFACTADRSVHATLEWEERPPWQVTLRIPGLEPAEASGNDLFRCLLAVREQVARTGWKVCVVGARVDAWPSRMSSQMGGASTVYVHTMGLQARESDLRPIFDDAPCTAVGSAEEQRQFRTQWLESLRNET